MNFAQLIPLLVQISIGLIVFSIALNATFRDCTYLLGKPWLLVRSLLSMYLIMPLFAVALALLFDLTRIVELALIAIALAPVPPLLPGKELKAGGARSYTIGLLVLAALFSIVYIPLAVELLGRTFGRDVHVAPGKVAGIVALTILVALVAGIGFRALLPRVAEKLVKPLAMLGAVLLLLAVLPLLIKLWPVIASLFGNFTIVAIVVFVSVGLLVGHLLGGPHPDERTVLALSTSARHPAIAITILHSEENQPIVIAAVILVLVVATIVSVPYVMWRRSRATQ